MIRARVLLALTAAAPFAGPPPPGPAASVPAGALRDSAASELEAGRAWHAARLLRSAGASDGAPDDVLLLARAEAGWRNHGAVGDLLAGVPWLDDVGDGAGWALLGRALEEAGRWHDAAEAYASYLRSPAGRDDPLAGALRARRVRTLARAGAFAEAIEVAGDLAEESAENAALAGWVAVELARAAAPEGDTASVAGLLGTLRAPGAGDAAWRLLPDARLAAGDTTGAIAAFEAFRRDAAERRAFEAGVEAGLLLLARGDTAEALGRLRAALPEAPPRSAAAAAGAVLGAGRPDLDETLRLAGALERGDDRARALAAYDRAARLAPGGGAGLTPEIRLARARLMASERRRWDEAIEEFRALHASTRDPRVGPATLEAWAGLRRRQGLDAHVATLRRWLLERYPGSPEAAEVTWARAWSAETGGAVDRALEAYEALAAAAPAHNRAGQARMRVGQIHLSRGSRAEAARVFEAYLLDFPDGRRWEEASYWAARARLALGDTAAARSHVARIARVAPFSYYAVVGAELLGAPYHVEAAGSAGKVAQPAWLAASLRRLDLLEAAGLDEGAATEEARAIERADGSADATLALASALIERGRTIAGIDLGWRLRAAGRPWDAALVGVVFPFPFREMVEREAREWGVDPVLLAAVIRQESAFQAAIVSRAGAVGLMQVMPPTGRDLARTHGPEPFREASLAVPDVNLHLGAAFLRELQGRYHDLPLVLSAYNAGPTRAARWRGYPEAGDWARFTERVPFDETRAYIKKVLRNQGVYRALYATLP